jgi:hypothetical protein
MLQPANLAFLLQKMYLLEIKYTNLLDKPIP